MKHFFQFRSKVVIAILLLLLLFTASNNTHGQTAQCQIVGVSQAIDGTMSPAALGGLHVTFVYTNFSPQPVFLNIWAKMPSQQNNFSWVAMNICLSPFNASRTLERSISLQDLGVGNNVRVTGLLLSSQQTPTPLLNPVTPSNFINFNCPLDSTFMFDSPSNEPAGAGGPAYLAPDFAGPVQASIVRGCKVPNIDLDHGAHGPVKGGYAGDWNACGPAAVANSLEWLQANVPGVGSDGLTPRERLEELSGLMGRKKKGDGVLNHNILQAKVSFCANHGLKVKVEYKSPSEDFAEDVKWLQMMYDQNQDIELDYTYIDEQGIPRSHAVVLTDLSIVGKVPQIAVKDDKNQKRAGGNGEEKNLELRPDTKGRLTFVRDGRVCTINNMYAESLDPQAGTTPGTGSGGSGGDTTVAFCKKTEKTCAGNCPALIVYYKKNGDSAITYPICAGKKTCCDINEVFTVGGGACAPGSKPGKCSGQCPALYRSKKDAAAGANPVGGKCDKASCNCVYEFIPPPPEDNNRRIPQIPEEGTLKIVPNPVSQQVRIDISGYKGTYQLQVVNLLGQNMMTRSVTLNGTSDAYLMDVSGFANGLYYVVLMNADHKLRGSFMKE